MRLNDVVGLVEAVIDVVEIVKDFTDSDEEKRKKELEHVAVLGGEHD